MQPKITPTTGDQLISGQPLPAGGPTVQFIKPIGDPLRPEKVAIVGTQPSSRMLAPFNDPTWTIWGTSPGNMACLPRVDAWIEMHCNFVWPQYFKSYGEAYLRWLNEQTFPVLAQDQRLIKRAIPYPLIDMIRRFGPYFFTSTFAYCMAYAISVGVKEMALYGVDMSSKGEYIVQRPGGHYFIQRAQEAGINVIIPQESDLMMPPPLYGYSDATDYGRKQATRRFEVAERVGQLEAQINQGQQQLAYLKGAAEDIDYNESVYASVEQLAVIKHMLGEEMRSKRSMPSVEAPSWDGEVAGLRVPDSVLSEDIGDIFPAKRKRKGRVGKLKKG